MMTPGTFTSDCPYCHRPLAEDEAPLTDEECRRGMQTWAHVAYRWVPHPTPEERRRAADTLTVERDAARREAADFQFQARCNEFLLELQSRAGTTGLPSWLDGALRQLLLCAHPDKWSAGQDATALAHEISIQLNTLRARLGEVR